MHDAGTLHVTGILKSLVFAFFTLLSAHSCRSSASANLAVPCGIIVCFLLIAYDSDLAISCLCCFFHCMWVAHGRIFLLLTFHCMWPENCKSVFWHFYITILHMVLHYEMLILLFLYCILLALGWTLLLLFLHYMLPYYPVLRCMHLYTKQPIFVSD